MKKTLLALVIAAFLAAGCSKSSNDSSNSTEPTTEPQVLHYDYTFSQGTEGFSPGFSDFPAGEQTFYELGFEYKALPDTLDPSRKGLYITGNNHSDDLFMFVTRKLGAADSILPSVVYDLSLEIELASNAGSGCAGIGGAPGEGVHVKAGATHTRPVAVVDNGFYRLNIDKGEQSSGGVDAAVIGDLANGGEDCSGKTWRYKTLKLDSFQVQASDQGEIWLIVGTDSGFEGITELYYTDIKVTLAETTLDSLPGKKN